MIKHLMRMQNQISYLLVIMAMYIPNVEQLPDSVQDYISKVTACMWFQTDYCSVPNLLTRLGDYKCGLLQGENQHD